MSARASSAATALSEVYVMGRTDGEYERLRLQAKLLELAAATVLEKIGIAPGMRCLDVGCGPAEVVRLMAERVGPSGRVVGLDVDSKLGEKSVAALVSRGLRHCSFIEGDIQDLEHVQGEPFDIVYARLFLIHQRDPIAALRKMYRWVKPGGVVVTQEYYFEALDSFPKTNALSELRELLFGTCLRSGKDPAIALKLPTVFAAAGLGWPDGTDVVGHFLPRDVSMRMINAGYHSVLPQARKQGIVSEDQIESFTCAVQSAHPDTYVLWPIMISAWKRKAAYDAVETVKKV